MGPEGDRMELCSHGTYGSHANASPGHLSSGAVAHTCGAVHICGLICMGIVDVGVGMAWMDDLWSGTSEYLELVTIREPVQAIQSHCPAAPTA